MPDTHRPEVEGALSLAGYHRLLAAERRANDAWQAGYPANVPGDERRRQKAEREAEAERRRLAPPGPLVVPTVWIAPGADVSVAGRLGALVDGGGGQGE